MVGHDFKAWPELSNNQMQYYYWNSPHKQITEDFDARVIKVKDGDTIQVRWNLRDFDFPIRFINIGAPELDEIGGIESREWLKNRIEGKMVHIEVDPKRTGKWGRILGRVLHGGIDVGLESMFIGHSVEFEDGVAK